MPRSAFLEGARELGGTKTCRGAIAKQKTAVPPGSASRSLAVHESDGRKREVATNCAATWVHGGATKTTRTQRTFGLSHNWRSVRGVDGIRAALERRA